MQKTIKFLLLFVCIVISQASYPGVGLGEFRSGDCLQPGWPSDRSDLEPDPLIRRGTLENGFRYVVYPNNKPEGRIALYLNIRAGSLHEKEQQRGLAHFLEHMAFNGSENYGPGELIEFFQSIGMSFGSDTNAHTSFDETVYKLNLPGGSETTLRSGLQVIADYAAGVLLLEEEVERERGIILEEKRSRDSESYRAYVDYNRFLMEGTLVPERLVIGEEEVIREADSSTLREYYDTWYRPDNMILVMVGEYPHGDPVTLIEQYFSRLLPRGEEGYDCPKFGKVDHREVETFYQHVLEMGQTDVSIQSIWNEDTGNDSLSLQIQRLYEYVAVIAMNNRLQKMVEDDDPQFTDSRYFSGDMFKKVRYSVINATANETDWEEALAAIDTELRKALTYGFLESELEVVKKDLFASLNSAVLTKGDRTSQEIATEIIRSLNDNRVFQSPEQELELYGPVIAHMSLADVNHALQAAWGNDNRIISVRGTAVIASDTPEREILSFYKDIKNNKLVKPTQQSVATFPYLEVNKEKYDKGDLVRIKEVDAERVSLANKVVLTYKKTDFDPNRIKVIVDIGEGKFNEPLPGMGFAAEQVFNDSGTGKLSRTELTDLLAGSTVNIDFRAGLDSFRMTASALKEDMDLLVQTIYTLIMDPAMKETAYRRAMKQIDQMYLRLESDVSGPLRGEVERFFAGGDSTAGLPPRESFSQFALQDLREWFYKEMRTGAVEVSIIGDFDKATILDQTLPYFSNLGVRKEIRRLEGERKFPSGEQLETVIDTKIDKAVVVAAWPTTDMKDIHEVRRLNVLSQIFEERVREIIREKLGASYSPVVYNHPAKVYKGYGKFISRITTDPKHTSLILEELASIADDLNKNGISADELEKAKKPLLTSLKDSVQSNSYWINSVLVQSVRYPEKLVWSLDMQDDYGKITKEEVEELAVKYLKKEKMATAIVRPEVAGN